MENYFHEDHAARSCITAYYLASFSLRDANSFKNTGMRSVSGVNEDRRPKTEDLEINKMKCAETPKQLKSIRSSFCSFTPPKYTKRRPLLKRFI